MSRGIGNVSAVQIVTHHWPVNDSHQKMRNHIALIVTVNYLLSGAMLALNQLQVMFFTYTFKTILVSFIYLLRCTSLLPQYLCVLESFQPLIIPSFLLHLTTFPSKYCFIKKAF